MDAQSLSSLSHSSNSLGSPRVVAFLVLDVTMHLTPAVVDVLIKHDLIDERRSGFAWSFSAKH